MNRTAPTLMPLLAVLTLAACGASEVSSKRVSIVSSLTFSRSDSSMQLDVAAVEAWLTAHGPVQTASEAGFAPSTGSTLSLESCHQSPHPVWEYRVHAVLPDGTSFDTTPVFALTIADDPARDTASIFNALGDLQSSTPGYQVADDGTLTGAATVTDFVPERFGNTRYVEQHLVTVDTIDVLVDPWSCGSSGAGPFTPN